MRLELDDWSEAADSSWEVVVVGAGLAGIVAAQQLALRGVRVLLLDRKRFPREKVCGGCLNGRAVQALRELGFGDCLDSLQGHRLRRLELFARRQTIQIDLPGGVAISRSSLDHALLKQAIAAGVTFLPGVDARVEPYAADSPSRQLSCRNDNHARKLSTSLVVIATGISAEPMPADRHLSFAEAKGSRIGVQITINEAPDSFQPGIIYMAVGQDGYVGLTRTEGRRLNLAAAIDRSALRQDAAAEVCRRIVTENGLTLPDLALASAWKGTCGLTRRRCAAGDRLFVVGDAGGYVEPFTGEGMELAIQSGRAVVDVVQRATKRWEPAMKSEWSRQFDSLVTRRQWVCRGLSRILRYPLLLQTAFGVTSRFPSLGRVVAKMVT